MLDSFFMRGLNNWELTLEQLETGALKAPKDSVYNLVGQYLNQPWMTQAWERTRANYLTRFQKLIDKQLNRINE